VVVAVAAEKQVVLAQGAQAAQEAVVLVQAVELGEV
jgi:hypothetical protein